VAHDRYIVIRAAYDRYPNHGRSLEWIAPELRDAGLILTEDHTNERRPWRTWAGIVDGTTFERFADAWGLERAPEEPPVAIPTEHGQLAARAYTFDGMNWEVAGESPIVYVSVHVGVVPDACERRADRPLAGRASVSSAPAQ